MKKEELLESLKCYIETLDETVKINLISVIEEAGMEVTDEILQYLYSNVNTLYNIKRCGHTITFKNGIKTEIVKSIIVYK